MILARLLTELTRHGVQLAEEDGRLKVQAPPGVLTADLRRTLIEQKAALLQYAACPYVQTIDGLGFLSGNTEEQDITCIAPERQEALRYKIGVVSLHNGMERFYYPRMVLLARRMVQIAEQSRGEGVQANQWTPGAERCLPGFQSQDES